MPRSGLYLKYNCSPIYRLLSLLYQLPLTPYINIMVSDRDSGSKTSDEEQEGSRHSSSDSDFKCFVQSITGEYDMRKNDINLRVIEGISQEMDGFKILQNGIHQRQAYYYTFAAFAKTFPDDVEKLNWLKDDDQLVLKVFNTSDAGYYLHNLKKAKEIDRDTTTKEFLSTIIDTYYKELKCYKLIWNYNEKHPDNQIHIPKLYDYGYVSLCKEDKDMIDGFDFLFGGMFILISYIENQPNSITQDAIDRCSEEMRIMYEELGISQNSVAPRNLIVNEGNIYIIDFSNAKLNGGSHRLERDQKDLRKVGSYLLEKREQHSTLEPPNSDGL